MPSLVVPPRRNALPTLDSFIFKTSTQAIPSLVGQPGTVLYCAGSGRMRHQTGGEGAKAQFSAYERSVQRWIGLLSTRQADVTVERVVEGGHVFDNDRWP